MRGQYLLPVLLVGAACADHDILQPVDAPFSDVAAAAVANPAQGGWEIQFTTAFSGVINLGDTRLASHNLLGKDALNAFAVTGDLTGTWYYGGQFHVNLKTGKGVGISHVNRLDITSPGTGSFVCQSHNWISDYLTAIVQYVNVYSCEGSGDYEGKKMKATGSNEANPGLFIYHFTGVIY